MSSFQDSSFPLDDVALSKYLNHKEDELSPSSGVSSSFEATTGFKYLDHKEDEASPSSGVSSSFEATTRFKYLDHKEDEGSPSSGVSSSSQPTTGLKYLDHKEDEVSPPSGVSSSFEATTGFKYLDHKEDEVSPSSGVYSSFEATTEIVDDMEDEVSLSFDLSFLNDLDYEEDEVSSTSSLSASPRASGDSSGFEVTTRLKPVHFRDDYFNIEKLSYCTPKFKRVPYRDDSDKIKKLINCTTKYKPIPYQEDKDKIEKLIKRGGKDYRKKIDIFRLTGFDSGDAPFKAGPLLQVFSVTISNESNPLWEDLGIFGEISITDGQNNTFYIYNCEEDEPELVSTKWNRLFLKAWPITPVYAGGKVKFSLTDTSGEILFKGNYDVDFSIDDAYPCKNIIKCPGKHGFSASMEYTKIPFAFIAQVSISIQDKNKDRVGDFYIHGTTKVNDLVLFEELASYPAKMEKGVINHLALSTDVLAVPIYSSLAVEIKLCRGADEFADEKFEFLPYGLHSRSVRRDSKDKSYSVWVDVRWVLYEKYFLCGDLRWRDNPDVKWDSTPLPRKVRDPPSDEKSKRALVEVFSVFVGGKSSAPLDLCGKIVVQDLDRDNTVFIFVRNSKIPDVLTDEQSRTVSLAWPHRWFVEKDFYMFLYLKDNKDNMVCRGHLNWYPESDITEQQYDRRFCDVIRGENGYFAAVHYSVFKNGKKSKVTISWNRNYSTVVYGSVYAAYIGSNYKYPSTYDKKYYQSIIFKRSVDEVVNIGKCSNVLLSKSHVSAPSDCEGLCLDVNLHYKKTSVNYKCFRNGLYSRTFEFKADETKVKRSRWFSVKVEWPSNSSE